MDISKMSLEEKEAAGRNALSLQMALSVLTRARSHVQTTSESEGMLEGFGERMERPSDKLLMEIDSLLIELRLSGPVPLIEPTHPEAYCQKCGGINCTWYIASPLWNEIVRANNEPEILCPLCFIRLAESRGVKPHAWELALGKLLSEHSAQTEMRART